MDHVRALLIAIPALPLLAAVVTAALGPRVLRKQSHWPTVVALAGSLACSLALVYQVSQWTVGPKQGAASEGQGIGVQRVVRLWTWTAAGDANERPADAPVAAAQAAERIAPTAVASDVAALNAQGGFNIEIALRADPLTAIMLSMVSFVALLVAIYSIGYMHGDGGYWRFFSYVALFVFSMTMLVSVSNFLLLFVFWEAVGLCSYLLIGFYYQRPAAAAAGVKAFLVNRIGDFGFALGLFLIWFVYRTLDFHDTIGPDGALQTAGVLGQHLLSHPSFYVGGGVGLAICLLLMAGACGKSAQFPLHVWLPDAMEGPSPVSALIHAATMVTAGVYMVARCYPLFMVSATAQQVVATIGCITVVLGALIALTQTDLKRILAYSTISQLGYMFLGLGAGTLLGATAGMFHLFTHAFFKALLFLAAGSVMHAMGGVIDLRQFGGLRRLMPATRWTFLFGCLALGGIVPFSGFFSKDMILLAIRERSADGPAAAYYGWLGLAATIAAGLTAFYSFRAYFLAFHGEERIPPEAGHHAHESPRVMTVPLAILAFCALVVGGYFEWTHGFEKFLHQTPSLAYGGAAEPAAAQGAVAETAVGHAAGEAAGAATHEGWSRLHWRVAGESTLVGLAGLALAAVFYLGSRRRIEVVARAMRAVGLYQLSHGKFFFDEIYYVLFIGPLRTLAAALAWFDRDGIDGTVDFIGGVPRWFGGVLRPLQNGLIQFYALAMLLGLLVLFGALLW